MPRTTKTNGYQTLAINIPVEIKSRLKVAAFASNRSPGQVVVSLLDEYLPQFEGIIPEPAEKT